MRIKTTLLVASLALGGSAVSAYADLITWQLNGTGTGGGIAYGDGTVVSGSVVYDTSAGNFVTAGNTISVTDPNWSSPPANAPAGCPNPQNGACSGVVQPGSTWYVDTAVSGSNELLMVNVAPDAGNDNLAGASYFSMVATGVFDGTDGLPANTGIGNPAGLYTEMLDDVNNGFGLPTFAGTCSAADCSTSDTGSFLTAPLIADQGNMTALNESTCPQTGGGPPTFGCSSTDPGAYFSTVVPAGPPAGPNTGTPEPSTFVLLGGALVTLGGMRLRKASK